jgi:RNA polymerase sigma-70 factor (ECF subfamily)
VYIPAEGGQVSEGELVLIQRSLNGDLEAWGEIVSRYKNAAFGVAMAIVRNRADAEDVVQDAFIRAYQRLDRYDLSRKFSTWLFAVTANVAKNALRRRRRDPMPKAIWAEDPAHMVWREDMEAAVREAVWGLPEAYRAPLVLRYWHELSLEEIAETLGLRLGTVKTRLHRARALVRAELAERGVIHDAV